jgi:hypothetical protein
VIAAALNAGEPAYRLTTQTRIIAVILAIAFMIFIVDLIRRDKLLERYSIVWFAAGALMIVGAAIPQPLELLTDLLGVRDVTIALFSVVLIVLLALQRLDPVGLAQPLDGAFLRQAGDLLGVAGGDHAEVEREGEEDEEDDGEEGDGDVADAHQLGEQGQRLGDEGACDHHDPGREPDDRVALEQFVAPDQLDDEGHEGDGEEDGDDPGLGRQPVGRFGGVEGGGDQSESGIVAVERSWPTKRTISVWMM